MKNYAQIAEGLQLIESHYKVKILYACESGTRAWGLPVPNSDYDIRFIYIRNKDYYLSITEPKDSISLYVDEKYGIIGWDIRKALRSFGKSNVSIYNWLKSPIIYENQHDFANMLQEMEHKYFSPKVATKHYLGLVDKEWTRYKTTRNEQPIIKSYLHSLRPLLSAIWITKHYCPPPMKMKDLLVILKDYEELKEEISKLLAVASANGTNHRIKPVPLLEKFIKNGIKICNDATRHLEKKQADVNPLNDLFRVFVSK